jgi:DNA modification methylase
MKTERVPIGSVQFDPANVRRHGEKNLDAIKASLSRFGQQKPIVVDADGIVRAGNGTLMAAKALGWPEVTIVRTSLKGAEATAYAIADNRTAELAEWDDDGLAQTLAALQIEDEELAKATGFDDADIDAMLAPDEVTEDEVPEPPVDPITKLGDLWLLGEHRVLCGDSTKADQLSRLMNGKKPEVIITDPPYGMNLDTDYSTMKGSKKSPNSLGYTYERVIGDDRPFDRKTVPIDAKEEIWFGADYYRETIETGGSWSVWVKRGPAEKEMLGNDLELIWSKCSHKRRAHWIRWVGWSAKERTEKRCHPTQKPVQLLAEVMQNVRGDLVVDPFLGSGTTLIAAEQLGRKCYGMEISPAYCDVIVKRWETLTGKKATRG